MAKPKPEIPQGRFVLQPCKIREDRVVASGDDNLVKTMAEFVKFFTVSGNRDERLKMRSARLGAYIGVCLGSRTKQPVLFVIWHPARENVIDFLLRKDRSFPERCHTIFKVLEADWGSRVTEPVSGKKDTPTWRAKPGAGSAMMERA